MSKRAYHDGSRETIDRFLKWAVDQPGSVVDLVREYDKLPEDREQIVQTIHEILFPETLKLKMGLPKKWPVEGGR